jgi:serine/threonine protein kinase/Tfp pilus assembly protein PilF
MIGRTISHYKILDKLGSGGMGVVYKAEDTKLHRNVAIKFLPPELTRDPESKERFVQEARAASALDHPNICTIYEIGETEDEQLFIAMAYYEGENLKDKIERVPLAVEKAVDIGIQIAQGLSKAHEQGIIHRDIKPANIMITGDGLVKILDFGLAKLSGQSRVTQTGTTYGTTSYMSPEQTKGEGADSRTDIWSLGVVLFEALSGKRPFGGDYGQAVIYSILNEAPGSLADLRSDIPSALVEIVDRCLDKEPAGRFQSMGDLCHDLEWLKEDSRLETQPYAKPIFPKLRKKRAWPIKVPLFLILSVFLIVSGYFLLRNASEEEEDAAGQARGFGWENSIAVLPFADLSPLKDQAYFCDGMTDEIISKLSRLKKLKVISRTSVMQYRDAEVDVTEIGNKLNVANILEGSVRREGDRIRVIAQLIDARDGFYLWSETYERDLESVFKVQEEVARTIADVMRVKFTADNLAKLLSDSPENVEAYEYYLRGMHTLTNRYEVTGKEDDFHTAVKMFEQAIAADPGYAFPYVGLAWAYMDRFNVKNDDEDLARSVRNCEKAYEMRPDLAEANSARATVHLIRLELDEAYHGFKRALELSPNKGMIIQETAGFYRNIGLYDQAVQLYRRALELNPLNTMTHVVLIMSLVNSGQFDEAMVRIEKALELEPTSLWCLKFKAELHVLRKEFEKAEAVIARAEKIRPGSSFMRDPKAILCASRGMEEEALANRESALVYALLGKKDKAIAMIEEALGEGYWSFGYSYPFLNTSPYFDNLREEPRFVAILEEQKKKHEENCRKFGDIRSF